MACRGCATRATRCSFISGRGLGRRPWTSDELLEAFDRTLPYGRHGLLLSGGGGGLCTRTLLGRRRRWAAEFLGG